MLIPDQDPQFNGRKAIAILVIYALLLMGMRFVY